MISTPIFFQNVRQGYTFFEQIECLVESAENTVVLIPATCTDFLT